MRFNFLDFLKAAKPRLGQPGFRDLAGEYCIGYREAEINGDVYFVPGFAMHRPAAKRVMAGQLYEPLTHDLIQSVFAHCNGSMVHAGAFFGDMLPSFSRVVDGIVWCFEPVTESYILANKCLARNELPNVTLFNAALSDKIGMVRMDTGTHRRHGNGGHRGGASFVAEVGTPTPTLTIDLFEYDALQVVLLDLEGHELPALVGARATLQKHSPVVLVEDNNSECAPFLLGLGYRQRGETRELKIWISAGREDHERIIDQWIADNRGARR